MFTEDMMTAAWIYAIFTVMSVEVVARLEYIVSGSFRSLKIKLKNIPAHVRPTISLLKDLNIYNGHTQNVNATCEVMQAYSQMKVWPKLFFYLTPFREIFPNSLMLLNIVTRTLLRTETTLWTFHHIFTRNIPFAGPQKRIMHPRLLWV